MTVPACNGNLTFDHPPQRVVTLGTDLQLAVAAAGGAHLIAKSFTYQGAPLGPYADALSQVPVTYIPTNAASLGVPSAETMIAERPDLVISYDLDVRADLGEALKQSNVKILTPNWRCNAALEKRAITIDDIYQQIDQLGQVLGTRQAAAAEIAKLRSRQAAAQQRVGTSTTKRTEAAVYGSGSSLGAYGKAALANSMLEDLGFTNVYGDVNKQYVEINYETLIARNPDVIIMVAVEPGPQGAQKAVQQFQAGPGAQNLSAVKQGHVIPIFFGYTSGGPLTVDGFEEIAAGLAAFK